MDKATIAGLLFVLSASSAPATFDVASVKISKAADPKNTTQYSPGGFVATNVTLKALMREAFNVKGFQLTGGPDWLTEDRFTVNAKVQSRVPFSEMRVMLQGLLAERFHLAFHRETRTSPVYALVTRKGGPKLAQVPGENASIERSKIRFRGQATFGELADYLSNQFTRVVVDRTGLPGVYDIDLDFSKNDASTSAGEDGRFDLISVALQNKLGLKLQEDKAPVETIVIDHVDRIPTEN